MLIYITFATIVFIGGFAKQSRTIYKTSLVVLFILTAFRKPDWGGYDSLIYMNLYKTIPVLSKLKGFESDYGIGYVILNSLSKTIANNYILFQVLLALITIFLINRIVEKAELKDTEKCFFIFSYFCYRFMWNTWVTYRQNISNLIVWLLIIILWKRRTVKETTTLIAGCAAASVFHSSSIANCILIPAARMLERFNVKKRLLIVSFTSVFLWGVGGKIFLLLLNFASSRIDARYGMYSLASVGTSNGINFIFRMTVFVFLCVFYDNFSYPNKDIALSALSVMVLLGSIQSELMLRLYEYYAIGLYLTLATCLEVFREKSRVIAALVFYLVMISIMIRGVMTFSDGVFVSYQAFF